MKRKLLPVFVAVMATGAQLNAQVSIFAKNSQ